MKPTETSGRNATRFWQTEAERHDESCHDTERREVDND
jgi:hypothetical protein